MSRGTTYLLRKLENYCALGAQERLALTGSLSSEYRFSPREDLIHERREVAGVFVILEGFAARYKLLPDGRRQIVGLLLPGDMCDLRIILVKKMDHSICALSPVTAALIESRAAMELLERLPALTRALWFTTIVEDSITREWAVNVGYRTAFERVAHLLCEVYWRLEAVGLARDGRCTLPLTQIELGEALALTSVHVNRTLMSMRRANLLRLNGRELELLDRQALELEAGFDPTYLHPEGARTATVAAHTNGQLRDNPR